jgi:hypothetical protein
VGACSCTSSAYCLAVGMTGRNPDAYFWSVTDLDTHRSYLCAVPCIWGCGCELGPARVQSDGIVWVIPVIHRASVWDYAVLLREPPQS